MTVGHRQLRRHRELRRYVTTLSSTFLSTPGRSFLQVNIDGVEATKSGDPGISGAQSKPIVIPSSSSGSASTSSLHVVATGTSNSSAPSILQVAQSNPDSSNDMRDPRFCTGDYDCYCQDCFEIPSLDSSNSVNTEDATTEEDVLGSQVNSTPPRPVLPPMIERQNAIAQDYDEMVAASQATARELAQPATTEASPKTGISNEATTADPSTEVSPATRYVTQHSLFIPILT